jgi:dTDP-4-dehydrorhamnose reductase
MVVLVTGAGGQLGQALKAKAALQNDIVFYFAASGEADITNKESLTTVFNTVKPNFCINAAAYTAVDKAESEPEKAFEVNVTGAANLAQVCREYNTVLVHVSTDFVFDGTRQLPYTEEDVTNPQSVYGKTKREGELAIQDILKKHYIIRTSWLYSEYGSNFMKTMVRLGKERDSLSVVNDQTGTPTNANDLAGAIIAIVKYHLSNYSNEGQCTWYDFAKKIFEVNKITIDLQPIASAGYPTPAKRPAYSVLDKGKIKTAFGITIPQWQDSLEQLVTQVLN